jgi:hypothetical protein
MGGLQQQVGLADAGGTDQRQRGPLYWLSIKLTEMFELVTASLDGL